MDKKARDWPRAGRPSSHMRPLAFNVSGRSSGCFGRINMRSFLGSLLVGVGKGLKPVRNHPVAHGLGSAEQSLCCF
jgi:hypothetical protein